MKFNLAILSIVFFVSVAYSPTKEFPSVSLKTLEGKSVNVKDYIGKGHPVIISYWATWCSPCKRELDAMSELIPDWKSKYGVELIAITIDDSRNLAKVPGLVKTKGWDFTILADSNQESQQALSFQTIPQTFLLDGNGNIVYSHNGYNAGDEFELEEKVKALKK
jgi:peroxiredoxin